MELTIEGGMVPMNCKIAIFDLKGALAPEDQPLMLEPVLFCPVLTWMAQELMCCGVQRYFIVCRENWREEVREALQGFDADFFDDVPAALSAAEEDVMVVPGPVVPVYGPEDRNVYAADAAVLRSRLREGTSLTDCPAEAVGVRALWQPREQPPAFRAFSSAAELNAAMPAARELLMRRMASNGVTVVDPVNTYVDPRCSVAPGVTLLPGTILRGHTAIAAGCEIGPNAMVRDCIVGKDTTINASQVNESTIGSHTTVGPFTYVRPNCRIGDHCRVGDFVEVKNSVIGDVAGKDCILFDDMVDTAGSLCNAAKAIVEVGGAKSVYACASHGVLSGPALERLENSSITELALLNTIPETQGAGCSKIKYLSVAPMFGEAIERIYQEISISKLFN